MGTKRTLYPIRNRRKKTTKTTKKKVNNNIKDIIQYEGLPQYGGGTPLTEEQLASQKLNAGIQAGAAGLGIVGNMVGNNQVDTTVENTHDNTFEGLMRNSSELDASASKGIDNGNVAGSALKSAGQGLSIGMATGNPYIAAGTAIAGGVTGLFTGHKAEKDRIADLKRQADERVSQAEGVKLNNLNSNLPTYQMATGGEIPPMTPNLDYQIPNMYDKSSTIPMVPNLNYQIPNENPVPDYIDPASQYKGTIPMVGYKPIWRDLYPSHTEKLALKELGITDKEYQENYTKDAEGYLQKLVDKLNVHRDLAHYGKSTNYTKYKVNKDSPYGKPTLSKNIRSNDDLKHASVNQLQLYNVPYSPVVKEIMENDKDYKRASNLYYTKGFYEKYLKRAYGGEISQQDNNAITQYTGQSHNGPNGGIPVDSNGNPSVLTGNKTVALTENGEVNYKGYIFSNRLKYQ